MALQVLFSLIYAYATLSLIQYSTAGRTLYPISGSWFNDRFDQDDINRTLTAFQSTGGDTVMMRGVQVESRTTAEIKHDVKFKSCMQDGVHCLDKAESILKSRGIKIGAWLTYAYEEDHSSKDLVVCDKLDQRIVIGDKVFYQLVLSMENVKTPDDCSFPTGSKAAVLLTYFSGKVDPHSLMMKQAGELNMTVYMGLPQPPYIESTNQSTMSPLMFPYYMFLNRLMNDHATRFTYPPMKGYYCDVEIVPGNILKPNKRRHGSPLPSTYMTMYWMNIGNLAQSIGWQMLVSPVLDLTHSGGTAIQDHIDGFQILRLFVPTLKYVIRDGRGDGTAAYFKNEHRNDPIYERDHEQWLILKGKNSSTTEDTTFDDIYYASVSEFFERFNIMSATKDQFGQTMGKAWLMAEAYDNIPNAEECTPNTPGVVEGKVQAVSKQRLDKVLSDVGALVRKVTAFAWDPLFTCRNSSSNESLADEIQRAYATPIISDCRFHSEQNQSIVVMGFNIDLPGPFQVNLTLHTGEKKSINLDGYFYDLSYGYENGLIDSLYYIQLWDIPDIGPLQKNGLISVARTDGTGDACIFVDPYSTGKRKIKPGGTS